MAQQVERLAVEPPGCRPAAPRPLAVMLRLGPGRRTGAAHFPGLSDWSSWRRAVDRELKQDILLESPNTSESRLHTSSASPSTTGHGFLALLIDADHPTIQPPRSSAPLRC